MPTTHPISTRMMVSAMHMSSCQSNDTFESRRSVLSQGMVSALGIGAAVLSKPELASASYTAYANRERDWEERSKNGEVKVSTARDLRAQLREIAPMNSEKSKVFCPNGPSAAVSPLMENKCGDRLATPSVYGRTSDIVGNSIPGASGGFYTGNGIGQTVLSTNPQVGGFPSYVKK